MQNQTVKMDEPERLCVLSRSYAPYSSYSFRRVSASYLPSKPQKKAFLLLLLWHGRVHINWSNARNQRNDVTTQNRYGTPRQAHHNSSIHDVSPRIWQSLHGSDDRCYPNGNTPTDNHSLFGGVEKSHGVEWSEKQVVNWRREREGEGARYDQRGELQLEPFVSFDVGEPETCEDVSAGLF